VGFVPASGSVGLSDEGGASSGMMVLFVKQVHLQKDVGAGSPSAEWGALEWVGRGSQAARESERKERKSSMYCHTGRCRVIVHAYLVVMDVSRDGAVRFMVHIDVHMLRGKLRSAKQG
jgi:hypothetical protein